MLVHLPLKDSRSCAETSLKDERDGLVTETVAQIGTDPYILGSERDEVDASQVSCVIRELSFRT